MQPVPPTEVLMFLFKRLSAFCSVSLFIVVFVAPTDVLFHFVHSILCYLYFYIHKHISNCYVHYRLVLYLNQLRCALQFDVVDNLIVAASRICTYHENTGRSASAKVQKALFV